MNWVHYVKVHYLDLDNKIVATEFFTIANNYAEATARIEEEYGDTLIAYSIYALDASVLYVEDIDDYLKEARGIFNG